jgi:membrane protease YdiL (CAAX protease family)
MGFLLAASLILSGSLWPAIIAHAALDLVSGLILGRTLLRES